MILYTQCGHHWWSSHDCAVYSFAEGSRYVSNKPQFQDMSCRREYKKTAAHVVRPSACDPPPSLYLLLTLNRGLSLPGSCPLCPFSHRFLACGQCAHCVIQLALCPPTRRDVHPARRRY